MTIVYSTDAHGNDFRREPANTDPADLRKTGRRAFVIKDREPQPGDGPDYHAEHAAWRTRNQNGADHE